MKSGKMLTKLLMVFPVRRELSKPAIAPNSSLWPLDGQERVVPIFDWNAPTQAYPLVTAASTPVGLYVPPLYQLLDVFTDTQRRRLHFLL